MCGATTLQGPHQVAMKSITMTPGSEVAEVKSSFLREGERGLVRGGAGWGAGRGEDARLRTVDGRGRGKGQGETYFMILWTPIFAVVVETYLARVFDRGGTTRADAWIRVASENSGFLVENARMN